VFTARAAVYDRPAEFVGYNRLFQARMVLCGIGAFLAMTTIAPSHGPPLPAAWASLLLGSVVIYRCDLWPAALVPRRERPAFALLALAPRRRCGRSYCCRSFRGAAEGLRGNLFGGGGPAVG